MFKILKMMFDNEYKELYRFSKLADQIDALDEEMSKLSDKKLASYTDKFKKRLEDGETLEDILVEAFAVAREAAYRCVGMKPFYCQLLGGLAIHYGNIAEMKTGEGKTLTCVLPAYLNALTGKGVHIVTVNDYLAKRDAEWMGQVHEFLGLTVGVILNSMDNDERREAYNCDITYATNNELGFDYLRDNMVVYKEELVQRELHYAIIDEVDSVLIDEARTPLIISGQSGKSTKLYEACDIFVKQLTKGTAKELSKMDIIMNEEEQETGDYVVDEKDKNVNLTEEGVRKAERFFQVKNLADPDNLELQHNINLALRAHSLMFKDKDYVVKDDEVLIVDEFTGRIMPGRRFSDGLHQAIEAKEHVKVKRESKTLATITFQNFFNKYAKKSGMTGTALTEEKEFRDIYEMDVVEVPTNLPVARIDYEDAVYKTKEEKFNAVVADIVAAHEKGQPVLVGTINIDTSEYLSEKLKKKGIPHKVLNAKFHELEAEIIADAGQMGAVTIATNMAGRGTDIKLGDGVKELGGLKIIGTERHESRRIDNQLRGRAGRQGDPGESRFYISLEDDLMRLFGGDRVQKFMETMNFDEDQPIEASFLSSAIESAQKKIEGRNFSIRKNVLDFDDVMSQQRMTIYSQRNKVLNGEDISKNIIDMMNTSIDEAVNMYCSDTVAENWNLDGLRSHFLNLYVMDTDLHYTTEELNELDKKDISNFLKERGMLIYKTREADMGAETMREVERVCLLKTVDRHWMDHIDAMEELKRGIYLRSYGQKDPVVEYRFEGFAMFDEMIAAIREETVRMVLTVPVRVQRPPQREQVMKPDAPNAGAQTPYKNKGEKIGRNDPCPCGSGKKYKNCCGKDE